METSVVIVDDHAGFRAAARRRLEAGGICVVGEADSGETGLIEVIAFTAIYPGIGPHNFGRRVLF